jgi:hypothetical protein
MKSLKIYYIILFLFVSSPAIYFGQEKEPAPPAPPIEPNLDFNFDFDGFPKMSDEEEKELLKNLNQNLKDELRTIKNVNKNKYYQFLRESQFKNLKIPYLVKRDKEIQERNQKIFELEVKTQALAAKYQSAAKTDQQKIRNELKQKLGELFEKKEEDRKQEVENLEQELSELKKSLEVRIKNKNEIINRRMEELLDEDKYLDWD